MTARIATGMATGNGDAMDFARAAEEAAAGLHGAPVDLAVVFAGPGGLSGDADGLDAVHERLSPRAVVGCGAQGVVAGARELERGGVAVWAASLPGARTETFHLEAIPAGESGVALTGLPDLDEASAVILLVDPYSFPVEPLLETLTSTHPQLPVIGGLASAPPPPGLVLDEQVHRHGAVGVAVSGIDVRACVSQGARPIGPEMVVTAAEGNVIQELASRPALERLKMAIASLEPDERELAAQGLLLGIVIDENQPEYHRGDFLIRGLIGVDETTGHVVVGQEVRVGQTVRMQVRDGASADEDLEEALERERRSLPEPPAGALLFTCNGRGSHMFEAPDHDATAVERAFGGTPLAGFFCAGEIGPVGRRNFVHGFTATLALFPR